MRTLLLFLCLVFCPRLALAQSGEALWSQATEHLAEGEDKDAAIVLERLSISFPQSPFADDALFLAGQLLEEKLGQPAKARSLYLRLVKGYPDSRASLAASKRIDLLQDALGPDDRGVVPTVRFQQILQGFPDREIAQSQALAKSLLREFPTWQGAHKVRLWLATSTRSQGDFESALSYYDSIHDTSAPANAKIQASFGAVEIHIVRGNHSAADKLLRTLSRHSELSQGDEESINELRTTLLKSQDRQFLLRLSIVVFSLSILAFVILLRRRSPNWPATLSALWPPPNEFLYLLPFAILFFAMALTGHEEVAPAIAILCGGGLVVSWLAGATMASMRPISPVAAGLCAALATAATLSLCYFALYRSQLLDLVATTVRFGPE